MRTLSNISVKCQTVNSLSLSCPSSLSYRNQSIDLQSKSMERFLYDKDLRHEIVKCVSWRKRPLSKHYKYAPLQVFPFVISVKASFLDAWKELWIRFYASNKIVPCLQISNAEWDESFTKYSVELTGP